VSIELRSLDELVDPLRPITYGVVKPGPEDPEAGVVFVRGGDIVDGAIVEANLRTITQEVSAPYSRTILRGGELVISLVGNPGAVAVVPDRLAGANLARQAGLIALRNEFHAPYLMYYLMSPSGKAELFQRTQGAVQQVINLSDLRKIRVRIPPLPVQKRVAGILSAFDDLIENNRRRIALLEQSARLLYREWFVHLRFPGHEHVKVVDGVPEGWERRALGDLYENLDRMRVPLSVLEREKRRGEYPYHGAAGVLDYVGEFIFEGRYLLMGEDGTVITSRGTPMLQLVDGKFWVNNHAHVMKAALASVEFLYCALSEYQIQGHVTGVAQPKITQKSMNRIPVLLPPDVLRLEFQGAVQGLFDQRFTLRTYIDKLRQARDLLLPRLISGELRLA